MRFFKVNGFRRIQKKTARRNYEEYKPVYFCPCKIRPGGMWGNEVLVIKRGDVYFDECVREYEYYHCGNEVGRSAMFWVKENEE